MKKIICFILILVLAVGFSVGAFAAFENTYENTGNYINDLIAVAETQIGRSETDGFGEYGSVSADDIPSLCGAFLSWCADEAAIPEEIIPGATSLTHLYSYFMNAGTVNGAADYAPVAGDVIFFGNEEEFTACGIVQRWDSEYVTCIIADADGVIRKKQFSNLNENIFAYATPDYTATFAYETGRHMTTASSLNFRIEPSIAADVITTLPMGTIVEVSALSGEWGCITYNGQIGWINMAYAAKYDSSHINDTDYAVTWNVIDVSRWQGDIDWARIAAANIQGVIMRIGLRGSKTREILLDENFLTYYNGATAQGLHVGCYFYSTATTSAEAEEEAAFVIDTIRREKIQLDMPVYADMEDSVTRRTGRANIAALTDAFMRVVENEGFYAGTYCSTSWAEDYYTGAMFTGRALWIADWRSECGYEGDYGMWQYTERGSVSGVEATYTDLNICYIDYPQLITDLNLNSLTVSPNAYIRGDANGDGNITAADARLTLRAAAGLENLSEQAKNAGDIDSNGVITASDARTILRISAGLESTPSGTEQ